MSSARLVDAGHWQGQGGVSMNHIQVPGTSGFALNMLVPFCRAMSQRVG